MPKKMTWIVVFLVCVLSAMSAGAIEMEYNAGKVDECPTALKRAEVARQMCKDDHMPYHCLPDEKGNLYQFCGVRRTNVTISFYQVQDGKFYWDEVKIDRTDSEFYSNLCQHIVNASRGNTPNKKPVFENYRLSIDKVRRMYPKNCQEGTQEHILSERFSCDVVNVCLERKHTPWVQIPVLNVKLPISDGKGNFVEKDFMMPPTDNEEYQVLSLVLCHKQQKNKCKECQSCPKYKCTDKREAVDNVSTIYIVALLFIIGMSIIMFFSIIMVLLKVVTIHRGPKCPKCLGGPKYEAGHPIAQQENLTANAVIN